MTEPQINGAESASAIYERLREQVRTENELYNQRIIWLISMNAFLFATVGLILQAKFGRQPVDAFGDPMPYVQTFLDSFLFIFSFVGGVLSYMCRQLLLGSIEAREEAEQLWEAFKIKNQKFIDDNYYPHAAGGKDVKSKTKNEYFKSENIPCLFVGTWSVFVVIIFAMIGSRVFS
ncbi:MAG: hypothetical protein AAFZ91_15260 [Pseudomonadota bacterium]